MLKKQVPIRKVAQSDLYVAKICFGDCAEDAFDVGQRGGRDTG